MDQIMMLTAESGGLTPAPTMTRDVALVEAYRCLMCWDAPCTRACPTSIDVPGFIKQIANDDMIGSARTILKANILGASCARVCPTEVLCAGACVLNDLHERPIDIGRLQAYATDDVVFGDISLFASSEPTGRSVGVVGAGPAGLSCGAELAKLGHSVVVYDANDEPGGLVTYGVANYKMDKATSLREVDFLKGFGVEIRQATVGRDVSVDELLAAHEALFLGVGLGSVPPLGLEGEDLEGVADALDFIADVRAGGMDLSGARVAVIGGGNTAIDASTQAAMLGADRVYLVYRRSRDEMKAYRHDIERALKSGVEFVHWSVPKRIEGNATVAALVCERSEYADDSVGAPRLVTVPDSEFRLPVTMILRATGQEKRVSFLDQLVDVKTAAGRVVVDEGFRTGNQRIWAGGDCVNGGKEVVNAVAHGKAAALDIDRTLRLAAARK